MDAVATRAGATSPGSGLGAAARSGADRHGRAVREPPPVCSKDNTARGHGRACGGGNGLEGSRLACRVRAGRGVDGAVARGCAREGEGDPGRCPGFRPGRAASTEPALPSQTCGPLSDETTVLPSSWPPTPGLPVGPGRHRSGVVPAECPGSALCAIGGRFRDDRGTEGSKFSVRAHETADTSVQPRVQAARHLGVGAWTSRAVSSHQREGLTQQGHRSD